jgi:hydroxymethylpyrimidine pyrophosphatase-like HAD family hydrolase/dTDP-4-dehydrorhamnose reductase
MDKNNNSINYLKKYMKYKKKYFAKNITGGATGTGATSSRQQPLQQPDYTIVEYQSEKHGFENNSKLFHPFKPSIKLELVQYNTFSLRSDTMNSDKEQNTTSVQSDTLSYVPFDLKYSKVFIAACDLDKTLYPIHSKTNENFHKDQFKANLLAVKKFKDAGGILFPVTGNNIPMASVKFKSEIDIELKFEIDEMPGIYNNGGYIRGPLLETIENDMIKYTPQILEQHPINKLMKGDENFLKIFLKWFVEYNIKNNNKLGIFIFTGDALLSFKDNNNLENTIGYGAKQNVLGKDYNKRSFNITQDHINTLLEPTSTIAMELGYLKIYKNYELLLSTDPNPDVLLICILWNEEQFINNPVYKKQTVQEFEEFTTELRNKSNGFAYNSDYRSELGKKIAANDTEAEIAAGIKIFETVGNGIALKGMPDPWPELDITVNGVSKGEALGRFLKYKQIKEYLKKYITSTDITSTDITSTDINNISAYNLAVFGDASNDLPMFNPIDGKYPICRVFMSSATEKTLEIASNIRSEVAPVLIYLANKLDPRKQSPVARGRINKHVFITGGSGSLGGSLIQSLLKAEIHVYNIIRNINQVVHIDNPYYHYTVIGDDGLYNLTRIKDLFEIIKEIIAAYTNGTFYFIHSAADKDTPTVKKWLKDNKKSAGNHWTITSATLIGNACKDINIKLIYISTIYVNKDKPTNNLDYWDNSIIDEDTIKDIGEGMVDPDDYIYGYTKAKCEDILRSKLSQLNKLLIIRIPGLFDYNTTKLNETSFGTVIANIINLLPSKYDDQQIRCPIDVSEVSKYIITTCLQSNSLIPDITNKTVSLYGHIGFTKASFASTILKFINYKVVGQLSLTSEYMQALKTYEINTTKKSNPHLPSTEKSTTKLTGLRIFYDLDDNAIKIMKLIINELNICNKRHIVSKQLESLTILKEVNLLKQII